MKTDIQKIGTHVEPFVDDTLIASLANLELRLHDPVKREVVLEFDQPWEKINAGFCTVLRDDDGKIRMYYRAAAMGGDFSDQQTTGVAFSQDGIHFERPVLGLIEHEGSKDNNLVWKGTEAHNLAPFRDQNPDAPPASRYKAVGGPIWKIYGLSSPDGLHWRKIREETLDHEGVFDTHNVIFWDTHRGCYRSFTRYFDGGWPKGTRAIQSASSKDFIHWSKPVPHVYADGMPLEQLYTNATTPYPGHPDLLLSFPMRILFERKLIEDHPRKGVSDAVFMTSRDGVHWDRRFADAWVRPGPDPLNWTDRSSIVAAGLLELTPDEWSLYISERYGCEGARMRRLSVRKHGFTSVHAGYQEGEFTTRPLVFAGGKLRLNFSTSATGSIQVELREPGGQPIPGFTLDAMEPIYGDCIDQTVTWKDGGDLGALAGKPVCMRFVMREADIFAMQIA